MLYNTAVLFWCLLLCSGSIRQTCGAMRYSVLFFSGSVICSSEKMDWQWQSGQIHDTAWKQRLFQQWGMARRIPEICLWEPASQCVIVNSYGRSQPPVHQNDSEERLLHSSDGSASGGILPVLCHWFRTLYWCGWRRSLFEADDVARPWSIIRRSCFCAVTTLFRKMAKRQSSVQGAEGRNHQILSWRIFILVFLFLRGCRTELCSRFRRQKIPYTAERRNKAGQMAGGVR